MTLPLFLLLHGAAIALMALLAFLLGRLVTLRIQFDSGVEAFALSTSIGLGILSLAIFALGMAGWLTRPVVAVVLSIGVLMTFPVWRRWGRARPRATKFFAWILAGLLMLVLLSPIWQLPLYPPIKWDGISYHLAAAKLYVESGAVILTPYIRFPVFPQAAEMLFTLSLLFADDITAKLTQFLMMTLGAMLLFAWGNRRGSARVGAWAAALWVGSPVVLSLSASAYVDVALALFVLAGAYAVDRWCEIGERGWLMAAAFLAGVAAATKYSGLVFLPLFTFWVLWRGSGRQRLLDAMIFLLIAAAAASPWYLRNALLTGDPAFPFLPEIFGYSLWSPEDVAVQRAELASHGFGKNPLALLSVWGNLSWNQGFFLEQSLASLALVIPMPLLFILRRRHARARFLAWIVFPYMLVWFWNAQLMRYLLPILPFLCLETAALLDAGAKLIAPLRRRRTAALTAVLGVMLMLAPGWRFARGELDKWGAIPVTASERDLYLSRQLPSYPAYRLLRERTGNDYTVYVLHDERMAYYADGRFMGDLFGPARASRIESRLGSGQRLYEELRRLGADHFLVTDRAGVIELPDDQSFDMHFHLVFNSGNVQLYELTDSLGQ